MQPKQAKGIKAEGGMGGLRLPLLREDLSKRMDFNPFKYPVDCIGVFASKLLRIFQRVCLDHDKTSRLIREWTG